MGLWEAARLQGRRLAIRLALDVDPEPLRVYRENFDRSAKSVRADDIRVLFDGKPGRPATPSERDTRSGLGRIDVLVAGPPCQGHSDLNNRTRRDDPRNVLYLRAVRAVEVIRPRVAIFENVPGVVHDRGGVIGLAKRILLEAGYEVTDGIASLDFFGVPQRRRRHVLVAATTGGFDLPSFLAGLQPRAATVGDYISGLEDEPETERGAFHQPSRMTTVNEARVDHLFRHGLYDLPDELRPSCHRDKEHTYLSMYGRMYWDKPAQTITSGFGSMGQGRFVHPTRPRTVTPHEAARLQGFPDFFDFSPVSQSGALRKMIGNAVPPQLVAKLALELIETGVLG